MRSHQVAVTALTALAIAGTTAGCAGSAPSTAPRASATGGPSASGPAGIAPLAPAARQALAQLATLQVKGRAPMTGYSRAQFGPAWSDDVSVADGHNGCDTRNDILRRDLTAITVKPDTHNCVILTGVLLDPYTGERISFHRGRSTSSVIQIDHLVALGDAWQTGASYWNATKRRDFANDPRELLAVDGSQNAAKGDADAASWLPPNKAYRCTYVEKQIVVKAAYGLWVTAAEKSAMTTVLNMCGPSNSE
ncbi:HNH endonuclease family protein [Rudaeicoccus suwonensis]|uniref:Uncharacterized protein DUF1524 n=1 Tax=Rudaeicoccus suwonensis TaxID=657409 RepID=A0A561EB36_9MICO|nr:HNH endonuclease family protein [Rudaeicoccus suwonensis]TWE12821.1 uncharacterized protein DUF1524 [Rudaeicoccus suwonensis]